MGSSLHNGTTTTTADNSSLLDGTTTTVDVSSLQDATEPHNGTKKGKSCHDTKEGERCYTAVMWAMEHGIDWAMQHGIHEHPDWSIYSGLDANSSFVDFQAALHRHQIDRCPEPCGLCRAAKKGELCYEA